MTLRHAAAIVTKARNLLLIMCVCVIAIWIAARFSYVVFICEQLGLLVVHSRFGVSIERWSGEQRLGRWGLSGLESGVIAGRGPWIGSDHFTLSHGRHAIVAYVSHVQALLSLGVAVVILHLVQKRMWKNVQDLGVCAKCGYDRTGLKDANAACPECGTAPGAGRRA